MTKTRLSRWLLGPTLCLGLLAAGAAPAHAVLITVEPDDFAAGTDLSTVVPGVTLSAFSTAPLILSVVPTDSVLSSSNLVGAWAPTGTRVFGTTNSGAGIFASSWYSGDNQFRADFTNPTDYVSILTGPDLLTDTGDPALFQIFSSGGILLDSFTAANIGTGVAATSTTLVAFSRLTPDIAYMIVNNPVGIAGESFILDGLTFNDTAPIPEPGTMLLLGTGLAGLAWRRRKL